jgi:F-type H+-transporting ATPase subunit alpha
VAVLWVATNGYLDDVPVERVREFENEFLQNLRTAHPEILRRIATEQALSDDLIAALRSSVEDFKAGSTFASRPAVAAAR